MSILPTFLSSPPPSVGLEIASDRVTAVALARKGSSHSLDAYAVEPVPAGAITPSLNATNVHDVALVEGIVRTTLEKLRARHRRVALVIPDTAAKVSLLRFEKVPGHADLDQLIRWQVRKAAPFKPEEAQISWVPASPLADGGREFLVTLARRDIVESYERLCAAAGAHAGIIDLASLNLINAVLASSSNTFSGSHAVGLGSARPLTSPGRTDPLQGGATSSDWLVVHVAPDYATLAIVRGADLIFFRTRQLDTYSDLADLVHQTAMYHEDRLSGGRFARVVMSGASARGEDAGDRVRKGLEDRLGVRVETLDFRTAAAIVDRIGASVALLDALAPAVGAVLREAA
jgi:type IV pilus assembly protein PilM